MEIKCLFRKKPLQYTIHAAGGVGRKAESTFPSLLLDIFIFPVKPTVQFNHLTFICSKLYHISMQNYRNTA